ncbi:MAG: PEP-CTERM-box response regulator transcription factor [Candidatus Krumholzibacteria bacterium]|nr:PEP-CTERM-box response regulator transcription factor [Candidatus Krumholzibacteria bacterium]
MSAKTLLIVDDEPAIVKNLQWAFKKDYSVITANTQEEALDLVRNRRPGLMLLDLSLTGDPEDLEGFHILESALLINPLLKIIVVTGHDEKDNALKAVEKGAYDFYAKPIAVDDLRVIVNRASQMHSLESELEKLKKLKQSKSVNEEFAGIIAMSTAMQQIFESTKKVAPADVSVLITGESGTGKELIARAIHKLSQRQDNPFVPINCGAIPENLLESELFGHEKGSFTGADASRPGKLEVANKGTIFLDEVGELSPTLQVKLLRFLQDQMIERVGGRQGIQVNVRVLAATNQALEQMIKEKKFREDLFYRINAIRINLPSLRDREDDVLLLATRFLHRYNDEFSRNVRGYGDTALEVLYRYHWPGNVRELENRVKRAVLMAAGKLIQPEDLDLPEPSTLGDAASGHEGKIPSAEALPMGPVPKTLRDARDEVERRLIIAALLRSGGNVSTTARDLDISRPTLHDLMKKHEIDADRYRRPR